MRSLGQAMNHPLSRYARFAAVVVALIYGAILLYLGSTGRWFTNTAGVPIVWDFLPVHVAGQMTFSGEASKAYDIEAMHRAQVAALGHDFTGFLGWHYPPLFFIVAVALAIFPYPVAFLIWVMTTITGFSAALYRIAGTRAVWMGLALPPTIANAMVGQNGFFTGALFGGFLLLLPTAPVAAGLLAALLSYKPQFGIVIPIALMAGGHWRAFASAAIGVVTWITTCALMAPSVLLAFLHSLPETSRLVLDEGSVGWSKLCSLFGLVRAAGNSSEVGWLAEGIIAAIAVFLVWVIWRREVAYTSKAALLAVASLMATPYIYFYDLLLLPIALAFLWRERSFDTSEQVLIVVVVFCLLGYALAGWPLGFFSILFTLAIAARRASSSGRIIRRRL